MGGRMLLFRLNSRSTIIGPGVWRLYGCMLYMCPFDSERNTFFLEIFVPDAKMKFTETFGDKAYSNKSSSFKVHCGQEEQQEEN